jgi:hypothetical protein
MSKINKSDMIVAATMASLFANSSEVGWAQISAAVRASEARVPKNGWLRVRSLLQGTFLNEKVVERTEDVFGETYRVVNAKAAQSLNENLKCWLS